MLAVDIGNTHTVLGVFRDGSLSATWRITTRPNATSDEIEFRVRGLLNIGRLSSTRIGCAVLATVVPSLERAWREALSRIVTESVTVLSSENCGFPIAYANPAQIGPDRLANALGVERLGLHDAIVIDLGTATTFDVIHGGTYMGGVICPGIETGMLALSGRTARLPQISLDVPDHVVGRTTEEALASGLILGHMGMMEYLVRRIQEEEKMPPQTRVLATGGWCNALRGRSPVFDEIHPDLTLEGLDWFSQTRL